MRRFGRAALIFAAICAGMAGFAFACKVFLNGLDAMVGHKWSGIFLGSVCGGSMLIGLWWIAWDAAKAPWRKRGDPPSGGGR